jgi:lipoprotein-anchoring transpeptidase ErfK/SrfK
LLVFLLGCSVPEMPPEVLQARYQEQDLRGLNPQRHAPSEFAAYSQSLERARGELASEESRFILFREYEKIRTVFRAVIDEGDRLRSLVEDIKVRETARLRAEIVELGERLDKLRGLSKLINEGRLSRKQITQAELRLLEAERLVSEERFGDAEEKISEAAGLAKVSTQVLHPIVKRFADPQRVEQWKKWAKGTIEQSRKEKSAAIIVSKASRTLFLYKGGRLHRSYPISLGINGSRDKLHAGDRATPEGEYRVVLKNRNSLFHKALLINYPNEEDRRRFEEAKRKGLIKKNAQIGGLIEIHGGGKAGMTLGCVALENADMDEVFDIAAEGTPVTIVGTLEMDNPIARALQDLS